MPKTCLCVNATLASAIDSECEGAVRCLTMTPKPHPLTEARKRQGWTRKNLARRVGVSESTISRIESRERVPSIEVLTRLASVLGWPDATWLKTWIDDPERS